MMATSSGIFSPMECAMSEICLARMSSAAKIPTGFGRPDSQRARLSLYLNVLSAAPGRAAIASANAFCRARENGWPLGSGRNAKLESPAETRCAAASLATAPLSHESETARPVGLAGESIATVGTPLLAAARRTDVKRPAATRPSTGFLLKSCVTFSPMRPMRISVAQGVRILVNISMPVSISAFVEYGPSKRMATRGGFFWLVFMRTSLSNFR